MSTFMCLHKGFFIDFCRKRGVRMMRKTMPASNVIGYFPWLRRCAIQEFCFFLSLSFLVTNLFFNLVNCLDSSVWPILFGSVFVIVASKYSYKWQANNNAHWRYGVTFIIILVLLCIFKQDVSLFLFLAPVSKLSKPYGSILQDTSKQKADATYRKKRGVFLGVFDK